MRLRRALAAAAAPAPLARRSRGRLLAAAVVALAAVVVASAALVEVRPRFSFLLRAVSGFDARKTSIRFPFLFVSRTKKRSMDIRSKERDDRIEEQRAHGGAFSEKRLFFLPWFCRFVVFRFPRLRQLPKNPLLSLLSLSRPSPLRSPSL